jgi:pyruvate formate lyase activating enzyme
LQVMKALYYEQSKDGKIQCLLCPHGCLIAPERHGRCRVRFNRGGEFDIPFYGRLSAVAVDPIEKKPLYHFYPASSILSIGFVGCSFHCPFCQNFGISQSTAQAAAQVFSPEEVVRTAQERDSFGIAYTYSEPLVHIEYVLDCARLARERGLKNVLVSNGFINPKPADDLLDILDAANIDLKTFNPEFYRSEIGGSLEEVKRFLTQAAGKIHLEVTTLVIPTKNDSPDEIDAIARFLSGLDPEIPYHLSCYYPTYRYTIPPTSSETVRRLAETARKHLSFVYLGNVGYESTDTLCPGCGQVLIKRVGYRINITGLNRDCCSRCGRKIPIVGLV